MSFHFGKATVSKIIKVVCTALYEILSLATSLNYKMLEKDKQRSS